MSIAQVVNVVEIAIHKLPHMEALYRQAKDEAEKMQRTIQRLANDIRALEYKISLLSTTAFSCEQECKRTEYRVQELTAQKDRLEKLIENILNGECYSKLKSTAKESVKAALSDNKIVISIAFAALLQTLKIDPQIVKLIQNIPSAADDNDSNNITKYFEVNRHSLLNLGEKNYENLVETLTNDSIPNVVTSSNPTSSLPQSSSTFPSPSNQSDAYRIEESEIYDDGKSNIAD
jgi:hypothetical protein